MATEHIHPPESKVSLYCATCGQPSAEPWSQASANGPDSARPDHMILVHIPGGWLFYPIRMIPCACAVNAALPLRPLGAEGLRLSEDPGPRRKVA